MWEVRRRITLCLHRKLEVRNRFVEIAPLNEIRSDIIIWISEIRIELDRLPAFRDGGCVVSEEAVRPSEERVRLGGRYDLDRLLVALDRFVQMTGHLKPVGTLQEFLRSLAYHGIVVS